MHNNITKGPFTNTLTVIRKCDYLNRVLFASSTATTGLINSAEREDVGYKNAKPFSEIPGPKGVPYLGTLGDYKKGQFQIDRMQDAVFHRYKQYGRIYKETIAGRTAVHLVDPEYVKAYYMQEDKQPSIPPLLETAQLYRKMRDLSPGLGNTNGEEWYRLRSAVQQMMMRPKEVVFYLPQVNTIIDEFIQRVLKLRDNKGEVPNCRNEVAKWSLESSAMTCFDTRLGCLDEPGNKGAQEFIDSNRAVFRLSTHVKFSFPWHKLFTTPTWRKLVAVEDYINRFSERLADETVAKIQELQEKNLLTKEKYNFMAYLLSRKELSNKDVKILALSLFSDGLSTTTPMAIFNLYCIATNPGVQEKLLKEVQSFIPDDGPVTEEALGQMSYLKACVKETFRFFPIGLDVSRLTKKDMIIGGYQIPGGTYIDMNNFVMARLPEYFVEPEKFMPERWLRDGSSSNIHPYIMIPFGHGPRMCAGRRFAEQELYVLLSKFVRKFRIEWHHGKMDQKYEVLMIPDRPAQFSFIDRK